MVSAQPREDPAARFRAGTELHRQGRFNEAAQEFLVAYRASGRSELLYNAYVAYRDGANLSGAADALREYLRVEPHPRHRSQLQAQLRALEARLRSQPRPTPPVEASPEPPPVAPAPVVASPAASPAVPPPRPPPPRVERPSLAAPVALLSVGGVALATGLVLGLTVVNADAELRAACSDGSCDPSLRGTAEGASARALVTDVVLGVGIASAAVGAVLLATTLGARSRASASAACLPGACGASVRVSF